MGREAGGQRAHHPDYLYGTRRPAIRRLDGGGGRSVSGWRIEQYTGCLRATGCSPQAVAGVGREGGGRGRRGKARPAESGYVCAGRAAEGWREGVSRENMRDWLPFGGSGDEPADE